MNCKRLPKFYEGVATAKLQDYLTTELKLPTPPDPGAEKQHMLGLIPTDTYRFNMSYRKLKAHLPPAPPGAPRAAVPAPRSRLRIGRRWKSGETAPAPLPRSQVGSVKLVGCLYEGRKAGALWLDSLDAYHKLAKSVRNKADALGDSVLGSLVPGLQGVARGVEARRPRCQGRRQGQGDAARALLPGCDPRRGERGAGVLVSL